MQKKIVLIYLFSYISMLRCDKNLNETRVIKLYDYIFPFDFEFGAGTSAYQSDGAWNVHGKVESIWDKFVHRHPEKIIDNGTGDIACNSYNFCRKDIQLAKELGVNYYQFSISWTRLFIYNDTNTANQYGLLYYHDILDRLRAGGIKARVTMYYWDLPQKLEDRGGWTNPETIKHFVNYARLLFQNFGHKVKTWITFSRPFQICKFGYGLGIYAPGRSRSGIDDYRCAHNILKAHAEVYHLYQNDFKLKQKGKVGISLDTFWYETATKSTAAQETVERAFEFHLGIFANPIFGSGDYPKIVRDITHSRNSRNGKQSKLPKFTVEEIAKIKGSADFFGLNYFSTARVENQNYETNVNTWDADSGIKFSCDTVWRTTVPDFKKIAPYGIRETLKRIKNTYNVSKIHITENGYADSGGVTDYDRANYILLHLSSTLQAIHYDNVPVKSYTVWSLIDQFEWNFGYTIKYGLFSVNFSNSKRERGIKLSSRIYASVIKNRQLPHTTQDSNSSQKCFIKIFILIISTILLNIFK